MDRDRLRATSAPDLIATAGQLAGVLSATHATLLEVLAVIDERQLWRADGCCSMADWITFRYGVARKTANEWTEAARALCDLPHLAEAFAAGELSFDKTKAVAAIASPDSDAALTAEARGTDVAHLDRAARRARAVSLHEAEQRQGARFFALRRSITLGGVRLSGFLPDVDGETLIKAIERLADDVPKDPDTGLYPSFDERCADALVDLAAGYLSSEQSTHGERAMVVTHVDLSLVPGEESHGETASGMMLASATVARLMCDAVIEPSFEDEGRTMGTGSEPSSGNKLRCPPGWMRRKLMHRDTMCRFPGCTRSRLVHSHHMEHWPQGPTEPENLIMLCRFHHRKMHEGGWSIRGNAEDAVEFIKPNGEVLTSQQISLSEGVKRRVIEPILPDG